MQNFSLKGAVVESIDVSARRNLEKTRSDLDVDCDGVSVPRMVSSWLTFGNLTLLQLIGTAVAVFGRCSAAIAVHC